MKFSQLTALVRCNLENSVNFCVSPLKEMLSILYFQRRDWDVERPRERGVVLSTGASEDRAKPKRLAGASLQGFPQTCVQTQLSDLAITLAL